MSTHPTAKYAVEEVYFCLYHVYVLGTDRGVIAESFTDTFPRHGAEVFTRRRLDYIVQRYSKDEKFG